MELPLAGGGGLSPSGRRLGAVGPPARPAGAQQPVRPRTAPPRDISALGGMLENLDNDSTFGGGAYFRFLETEAGEQVAQTCQCAIDESVHASKW